MKKNCSLDFFDEDFGISFKEFKFDLEKLRGKTVFITGGTGFIGKYILVAIRFLNRFYGLGIKTFLLSRDIVQFLKYNSDFTRLPDTHYIEGDVRYISTFTDSIDYIIHGAADVQKAQNNLKYERQIFKTIVDGTTNILSIAGRSDTKKLLFLSSGAVYGEQPPGIKKMKEDHLPQKNNILNLDDYSKGKIKAEQILSNASDIEIVNARLYSFVGPYIPLDAHFAAGNFIHNVLKDEDIVINGDGTARRSYMYCTDCAVWVLIMLLNGRSKESYNVGSDKAISIFELANEVAGFSKKKANVIVRKKHDGSTPINIYVPDISKAKEVFGLSGNFSLRSSLEKTFEHYRNTKVF